MAAEAERFQVSVAMDDGGWVAVLVDSMTGRSWASRDGGAFTPIGFAGDAPGAPQPPKAKRMVRRGAARGRAKA